MIAARKVLEAGLTPLVLEADERVGGRILTEEVIPGCRSSSAPSGSATPMNGCSGWRPNSASRPTRSTTRVRRPTSWPAQVCCGRTSFTPASQRSWRNSSWCCAASTSWRPRFRSRRPGWHRVPPNGTPSPPAPGTTPRGFPPVARNLLEICTVGILAVPTAEVSFLHLLFTIQTCGVTSELFAESEGGAQTTRFVGGTSEIPRRLAALIADHIVLEVPVQLIEHSADSVTVHCRGGLVARGRRVIVAISPTLAGPDHVRPAAFRGPRSAHPAAAERLGDEGVLRLRRALLARRRIQRPAHLRRRPGPDVQRHLHSRRRPRRDPAVPGRRSGAHRRPAAAGASAGRR